MQWPEGLKTGLSADVRALPFYAAQIACLHCTVDIAIFGRWHNRTFRRQGSTPHTRKPDTEAELRIVTKPFFLGEARDAERRH